jgi:hypothetical protein
MALTMTQSSEDSMPTCEITIAHLAVEYWKLLRTIERALEVTPEAARQRIASQARYAASRLDALLGEQNMSLQVFDGLEFEVNLPASAINGEEFQEIKGPVVERTLEPAVVSNMRVVLMGKVLLAGKG